MRARLLFNALVHQYLIPGSQVGTKVDSNPAGKITDIFAVSRPVTPDSGCLICNNLIDGHALNRELTSKEDLQSQGYLNEPDAPAPSVITLNALATAQAVNDFLFYITGMMDPEANMGYIMKTPLLRNTQRQIPAKRPNCRECGQNQDSRLAKGDAANLPLNT